MNHASAPAGRSNITQAACALAVSALLFLAPGCARQPSREWLHPGAGNAMTSGAAPDGGWTRVAPTGAGLAFATPMPPHVRVSREVHDDGTPVTVTHANCETQYATFVVSVAESEGGLYGDPLREADRVAERIAGNLELQDRRTTRLDVAGFYGREEIGRTAEGVFVAIRIYIGQRRVYVAFVATPAGAAVAAAEQFMGSLQLDQSDALYPVSDTPPASATWAPLFMPEDDFAIRMPIITGVTTSEVHVGTRSSSMRTYEATVGGTRYRVRVLPFEEGPPELAEVSTALSLGTAAGPTHASGYPGLLVHRDDDRGDSRLIRTASRVYVMEVQRDTTSDDETARQFFDSLRIL